MQFDLRIVDPPMLEPAVLLGWLLIVSSAIGTLWALWSSIRGDAESADRIAWGRASVSGVLVGSALFCGTALNWEPDYYLVLLVIWVLVTAEGAGLFLWLTKREARGIGRRVFQSLGVCCTSSGVALAFGRALWR